MEGWEREGKEEEKGDGIRKGKGRGMERRGGEGAPR